MTLIDILAALSEGSLPSTAQLLSHLSHLQSSSLLSPSTTRPPHHADELDAHHHKKTLLRDVQHVLAALQVVLRERNGRDDAQELLWRLRGEALKLGEELSKEEIEARKKAKEEAKAAKKAAKLERKQRAKELDKAAAPSKEKARTAYDHLLTLVRITLVQPELRHILADFALLGLEIVDQTASDTFGEEARHDLGQAVQAGGKVGGTIEGIIRGLKEEYAERGMVGNGNTVLQEQVARLAQDPPAAAAAAGSGNANGTANANGSAQLPNLLKLKARTLALVELARRKQRGEDVGSLSSALPTLDELRALLAQELGNGLGGDVEIEAALAPLEHGTTAASTEPDGEVALPAATATPVPATNGHDGPAPPLARTDMADLLQLIGVDSLLSSIPSRTSISTAKLRAKDAASKARIEGAKNARVAWREQGQDRLLSRLRRLLCDVQSQDSSRQAALWFLEQVELLVEWIATRSLEVPQGVAGKAEQGWEALGPGVKLLEGFQGGRRVRPILGLVQRLSRDFRQDPELRTFVRDVDQYLRDSLLKPGWVLEQSCEEAGRALVARFQGLGDSYRQDLASLLREVQGLFEEVPNDPAIERLKVALKGFGKDLTLGRRYMYFPKPHVWQEIFREILPPLFTKIDVLPIPRIKYTHPDFVLTLENLAISLRDLIPNTLDVRVQNDFHVDFKRLKSESSHCHRIKIKVKGMGLRIHKVAFAVELLKGVHFKDKGILDLLIRDVGLSIVVDVPKTYSEHFFTVHKVKGKLGKLQIAVRQSNHAILHKLAEGLVDSSLTKFILRQLMAKGVTIGLKQLDVALMQLRLNPAVPDDRKRMVRLKQQAAELRDLMIKLREQAGTLEVDFLDVNEDGTPGKSRLKQWQEETHVLRWVKGQVKKTGTREIKRDRWRSNVFDLEGEDSMEFSAQPASAAVSASPQVQEAEQRKEAAAESAPAQSASQPTETRTEAAHHAKPQGPTTQATVEDAAVTLEKQKVVHWPWFRSRRRKREAESRAGKEAEKQGLSTAKQVEKLEERVEQPGRG